MSCSEVGSMRMLEMELFWKLVEYYFRNEEKFRKIGIHRPQAFIGWAAEVLFRGMEKMLDEALKEEIEKKAEIKGPKPVPAKFMLSNTSSEVY